VGTQISRISGFTLSQCSASVLANVWLEKRTEKGPIDDAWSFWVTLLCGTDFFCAARPITRWVSGRHNCKRRFYDSDFLSFDRDRVTP